MKSEMRQTACSKCKNIQSEIISYQEVKCNHILHLIVSIIFFPWVVGWLYFWQKSKSDTEKNINNATFSMACENCGASLMLLN